MKSLAPSPTRRWLFFALAAVLLFPLAVTAQDRSDRAERLKQALALTDAQVSVVNEALGDEVGPGSLWNVAAALTPTLTDEQKEMLFTRPERGARDVEMQSRRGERGQRGERSQRERPDADARAERRTAMQAEMQEALGLSDAQLLQLEALHAEKQAEREAQRAQRQAQRPEPGELSTEMAAILTPAQQEVAKVHRALAAHMIHGRHRGGARR